MIKKNIPITILIHKILDLNPLIEIIDVLLEVMINIKISRVKMKTNQLKLIF